jgi:hypothetical protein
MEQIRGNQIQVNITSLILISSGSFESPSVADKIYEEENEVYSSTQHNESQKDEKSQDDLNLAAVNHKQLLIRKKDPSFLETLYNHKSNLDNERVVNARRRLEEKYSSSKWKMSNELLNSSLKKKSFATAIKQPQMEVTGVALPGTPHTPQSINYHPSSQ